MTVLHTHYLLSSGPLSDLDTWATLLALTSRGTQVLSGEECIGERRLLASEIHPPDGGSLAELLLSDRPVLVDGIAGGYRIEEVQP